MRDCPGCNAPLANNAIACNSCGWEATPRATPRPTEFDRRCSYVDQGRRCDRQGSIARGGVRWLCSEHHDAAFGSSSRCGPPGGFESLRDIISRLPSVRDLEAAEERDAIQGEL